MNELDRDGLEIKRHKEMLNGIAEAGLNIFRGLQEVATALQMVSTSIDDFRSDIQSRTDTGDAIEHLSDKVEEVADAIKNQTFTQD